MSNSVKTILLVGGTGYLGRHLSAVLTEKYSVYSTGTKPCKGIENYFRINFKDNSGYNSIKGLRFDLMIILAASIRGLDTTRLSHQDLDINADGYRHFLQYIMENNITKKIIYISSMTVYSEFNQSPVSEGANTLPLHTYGLSKLIAEQLTLFACSRNNVPAIILRLPGVYGGDRKSGYIYTIAERLKKKQPVDIDSSGLGFWETMEIGDLCLVIDKIVANQARHNACDIINISYGHETDFIDTAFAIKRILNSDAPITVKKPLGYTRFFMDNSKLKQLIDFDRVFDASLIKYVNSI